MSYSLGTTEEESKSLARVAAEAFLNTEFDGYTFEKIAGRDLSSEILSVAQNTLTGYIIPQNRLTMVALPSAATMLKNAMFKYVFTQFWFNFKEGTDIFYSFETFKGSPTVEGMLVTAEKQIYDAIYEAVSSPVVTRSIAPSEVNLIPSPVTKPLMMLEENPEDSGGSIYLPPEGVPVPEVPSAEPFVPTMEDSEPVDESMPPTISAAPVDSTDYESAPEESDYAYESEYAQITDPDDIGSIVESTGLDLTPPTEAVETEAGSSFEPVTSQEDIGSIVESTGLATGWQYAPAPQTAAIEFAKEEGYPPATEEKKSMLVPALLALGGGYLLLKFLK